MHLTEPEQAVAQSWGPALLLLPSGQLFLKPSFNLTQLHLFLSLLVRDGWQIPLYYQALKSVTHYIKVGGSGAVELLLCSFEDSSGLCVVAFGLILGLALFGSWKSLQKKKKRVLHTPFFYRNKNSLSRCDTWHFPATFRRSIFHQAVASKLVAWVLHDFRKVMKY